MVEYAIACASPFFGLGAFAHGSQALKIREH
jgi:hypothetical protein